MIKKGTKKMLSKGKVVNAINSNSNREGFEPYDEKKSIHYLRKMNRLKQSIEIGAKLMRFKELLEPLEPEKIEVQFGYDIIDSTNYNDAIMESRVDYAQATVGKQNPFMLKIDSEILFLDIFKLNMNLCN
jgi:hypothetical protein